MTVLTALLIEAVELIHETAHISPGRYLPGEWEKSRAAVNDFISRAEAAIEREAV